jgi:hypothetical protein
MSSTLVELVKKKKKKKDTVLLCIFQICTTVQWTTMALISCPYADCCLIFTSLYRMPCILIATIGIILYLNFKKSKMIEFWEITLSSSHNLCPPHCEQTRSLSLIVFGNPRHSVQMALLYPGKDVSWILSWLGKRVSNHRLRLGRDTLRTQIKCLVHGTKVFIRSRTDVVS